MQGVRSGLDDTVSDMTDTLQTRLHILGGSRLFACTLGALILWLLFGLGPSNVYHEITDYVTTGPS
jgi:hypothetical protein